MNVFDLFYDWIVHLLPDWLQGFCVGLLAGIVLTALTGWPLFG